MLYIVLLEHGSNNLIIKKYGSNFAYQQEIVFGPALLLDCECYVESSMNQGGPYKPPVVGVGLEKEP